MIQTSKLWKCIQPEIVKHCRQEKSSTISKRIKKSVPDKYSKHGAGVFFQLFVQSGHFYLIVRPKLLQLTSFFWGGGGGGRVKLRELY